MILPTILQLCLIINGIVSAVTSHCSNPNITKITDAIDHADFPTWDRRSLDLWYVGVFHGNLYRYDSTKRVTTFLHFEGALMGSVIPTKKSQDLVVVGHSKSLAAVYWKGGSSAHKFKILTNVSENPAYEQIAFSSGKADKEGRLLIQTMGNYTTFKGGALYEFTRANIAHPEIKSAPVNDFCGFAWNKRNNKLFRTGGSQIIEYKYKVKTGEMEKKGVAFDLSKHGNGLTGKLLGMVMDKEGKLWVAVNGGGCVIRVDPWNKKILQTVKMPTTYPTSVMWGGKYLDILFVTTSRILLTEEQKLKEPSAGCVFEVRGLGVKGLPAFETNLIDSITD